MKCGVVISSEKALVETLHLVLSDAAHLLRASTAHQGMKEVAGGHVDFVILDSCVKDSDTAEAVRKLLQAEKSTPVIVLVPSIHSSVVDEVKEAGAYAVVEKPFDRRGIRDLVERAIERKELLHEIEFLKSAEPRAPESVGPERGLDHPRFYHELVRRFSKAISQVFDHKKLLDLAVEGLIETFGTGRAAIFLFDQRVGKYIPIASSGYLHEFISTRTIEPSDLLPVWLSRHNRLLLAREMTGGDQFELYRQASSLDAEIISGLFAKGKLIGILALGSKATGRQYGDTDLELLSILTNYLAVAVENALLYRDIARSRAHNEQVLNYLRSGIVTIDSKGIVTLFNAAAEEIIGCAGAEIVGHKIEKMGSVFADLLLRTLQGEVVYTRHEIVSPVNKKPLGVSTSGMRDEEGHIVGAIMVCADLSAIKRVKEKEKDFERIEFWAKMASRLAHEVKNPLVPIKTFAQLLPQRYKDREFREEFFKVVNGEIERLNDIITQLTKFADSPPVQLKSIHIHKVIEDALNSERAKLTTKGARVVKNFAREPLVARIDSALLSEAFANIIDNAADAIAARGTITITTALSQTLHGRNGAVEILFEDNGEGMTAEELGTIFTPFSTSKTRGMGLGLAIARRIVMDHQGSIGVDSAPGKGSVVKVVIPIETAGQKEDLSADGNNSHSG